MVARKLRLEYPGAIQHVINRGNYRRPIFLDDRTKHAFECCLFEACEKSNWLLHSFIVMRNHFHLGLETPDGNLVAGMQWLQSTFSNRFNRFRHEHGHLFQGRFTSILTENGKHLGDVCDYIHLNPIKAGILPIERLVEYRYSSYWYLHHPGKRPSFLQPQTALAFAGGLHDNKQGRAAYALWLEFKAGAIARARGWNKQELALCRGWSIGSELFKERLVKEFKLAGVLRSSDRLGVREMRLRNWSRVLQGALAVLGQTLETGAADMKSTPWKLAVAAFMKSKTQVSNSWLSSQLNMGAPNAMSHNLTDYRKHIRAGDGAWKALTAQYEA